MNPRPLRRYGSALLLSILPASPWTGSRADAADPTALDTFVYPADPAYGYSVTNTSGSLFYTRYILRLTSGNWRDASEVDQTLWNHWLTVYVPNSLSKNTALLVVSGGSNDSFPDLGTLDDTLGPVAVLTGSVVADLGQVPNQPLVFADETEGRSEDALLAYSWKKFLENPGDPTWPGQLPMTRAAVRAMDALQAHLLQVEPAHPISDFIVAGASKRGWTTWLTAVAENGPMGQGRVSAIVPLVIDALNTERNFDHHFKVYGAWAPAVHDYVDAGVMDHLGTPEMTALSAIIDPYSYLDRLTMPKFIYNSAGDQFFPPDSWKFYYPDLPGPKWLRYLPNTDHSLSQLSDPYTEILPLYTTFVGGGASSIPNDPWVILPDGTIEFQTGESGVSVDLWQATNPTARDFRYETIGAAYTSTPLADQGGGVYSAQVTPPAEGWTAYFLEATYSDGAAVTSGIHVVTEPQAIVLRIRQVGDDFELSFNSKRGEWYQLHAGENPDDLVPTDTLVPTGDTTIWIDPNPASTRKFYVLESITP